MCCSVSQYVAVCCSVLQCVAACCKHMNKILKHNVCTCVTMCVCVCVCAMCVWCFVPLKRQHSTSASSCMSRQCEQKVAAKGNGGNKSSQICKIRDETLVLCCPVALLHEKATQNERLVANLPKRASSWRSIARVRIFLVWIFTSRMPIASVCWGFHAFEICK